jgi:UDP-N-acetylglucosamine 4-epimerase
MAAEPSPAYGAALAHLTEHRHSWLVTGAAGFIGSHLVEALLRHGQRVVGLDNFATGHRANLDAVCAAVGEEAWSHFRFIEGDITDGQSCREAVQADGAAVEFVLHHAALGSVPRSMLDPLGTHQANVDGTLQMLLAARDAGVRRLVYASSSSVYGDDPAQPKRVGHEGKVLSPYALSKRINEESADLFARVYGLTSVGMRYFNVFGPRQDPNGPYAAVIPRWVAAMRASEPCTIHGDGTTGRDFCFVANVVQANLLAALSDLPSGSHTLCNIAVGQSTSLTALHALLRDGLIAQEPAMAGRVAAPTYGPFRAGDIQHSQADISDAQALLGYAPTHRVGDGVRETLAQALPRLSPS